MEGISGVNKKTYKLDVSFIFVCVLTFFMTFVLLYVKNYVQDIETDIWVHTEWVKLIDVNFDWFMQLMPYPLWHFIVFAVTNAFLIPHLYSALLVTAAFNALTVAVLYLILKKTLAGLLKNSWLIGLAAIALIMVMPLYAPWFSSFVYAGQWAPNVWHNPTYLAVRPVALITVYYMISLYEKLFDGKSRPESVKKPRMSVKDIMILLALVVAGVFLKPSFIQFFLVAVVVFLIIELIYSRGFTLAFSLQSVLVFIPAGIIILLQLFLMFGEGRRSEIALGFAESWSRVSGNIIASFLLNALFPLYIVILNIKKIFFDKKLWFALLMFIAALIEYLFLYEVDKINDQNFAWGYMLALFFLWVFTLETFLKNYAANKNSLTKTGIAVNSAGFVLLFAHVFWGVYYYISLFISDIQY